MGRVITKGKAYMGSIPTLGVSFHSMSASDMVKVLAIYAAGGVTEARLAWVQLECAPECRSDTPAI